MKYKEQTMQGYTRAETVVISNPVNGPVQIRFNEEACVTSEAGEDAGLGFAGSYIIKEYTEENKGTAFPLLDPNTDGPIGSFTYEQLMGVLYSLYFALAEERDTQPPPVIEEASESADPEQEDESSVTGDEDSVSTEDDGTVS
jgi:hypothetical protein